MEMTAIKFVNAQGSRTIQVPQEYLALLVELELLDPEMPIAMLEQMVQQTGEIALREFGENTIELREAILMSAHAHLDPDA